MQLKQIDLYRLQIRFWLPINLQYSKKLIVKVPKKSAMETLKERKERIG